MSKHSPQEHVDQLNELRAAKHSRAENKAELFEHNPLLHAQANKVANENMSSDAERAMMEEEDDTHSREEFRSGYIKQAEDMARITRNTFRDSNRPKDNVLMFPLPAQQFFSLQFQLMNQLMDSWFTLAGQMMRSPEQKFSRK